MSDDLLARLREAAHHKVFWPGGPAETVLEGFSPEQVQRGLERLKRVEPCTGHEIAMPWVMPSCDACWVAMLDAFLVGVRDA